MTNGHNGGPDPERRSAGTGIRVGDRYELGELLGRGGMAEVRKGNDVRLGRVVAVKRLRTDLASDATFQARFRREAQSAASLNHPAIVAVYDTGEEHGVEGSDVPQPYIVMEYVAGRTLRDILREGRKILPERALEITSGVLSALDYSHRAGIVHRDIKPANVMLTPAGDVKVMDFGIARAVADASSTMTQTAAVVGTAQYLSPEQARGETVDSRSDVYSTGCLLYELLTGRPPFVGESPVSVAYQHVREQAAPPSSLDPDLPSGVDAIVMKALAKRVEDRYQSAAAMRADIERFLAGKPVTAPVVPADDDATAFIPPGPETESTSIFAGGVADEEEQRSRKRWPYVLLALLVLALVAVAAVFGPMLFRSAPAQKTVPTLMNLTQSQAQHKLKQAGLKLGTVAHKPSAGVPKGKVMAQDPKPTATVAPGSPVNITVSTGKPTVIVPYVTGMDKNAAKQKIENAHLRVKLVQHQSDSPKNTVINTKPGQAEKVSKGSLVVVYYSAGPHKVPNVVGMGQKHAVRVLKKAGFVPSITHDSQTPSQKGTVLQQSPSAYSHQPQGTTVVITVSSYQTPSPSPTPTQPTPTTPTPTGPTSTPSPSVTSSLLPSPSSQ